MTDLGIASIVLVTIHSVKEMNMNKMQKIVLILTFWFSNEKQTWLQDWATFASNAVLDEDAILACLEAVVQGTDANYRWDVLEGFKNATARELGMLDEQGGLVPDREEPNVISEGANVKSTDEVVAENSGD